MFPNETSLTSLSLWARGSGLEIALFVTGTILLTSDQDFSRDTARQDQPASRAP